MPTLRGATLVLATHNAGKVREFEAALADDEISLTSAGALELSEPEETGATFRENALIKARAIAEKSGLPSMADDSGLAVTALGGAPGIYSARWAGPDKNFVMAMERIEENLCKEGHQDYSAAFICVLALAFPNGEAITAEGRVEGTLRFPPRGENGFGYDPIFVPDGEERSFAEMTATEKAAYSHRMRALAALRPLVL